jgi:hypothetical protein
MESLCSEPPSHQVVMMSRRSPKKVIVVGRAHPPICLDCKSLPIGHGHQSANVPTRAGLS